MILTKDNLKLGLVLGLIGPLLGLLVVYLIKYSELAFADFFELFINTKTTFASKDNEPMAVIMLFVLIKSS